MATLLKDLLNCRYKEATGFGAIYAAFRKKFAGKDDRQPRNYQITQAILALFQRVRRDSLDEEFKRRVCSLLQNADGAKAGEAALLLYLVDRSRGLHCLRRAFSGKVPAAHKDAAAACVMIGDEETKNILNEALCSPNLHIQHTAACALAAFPAPDAAQSAQQWFARNDGIKQPLGKEVTLLGRTAPVFTFEEVSHANMDQFFNWSLEKLRKDFQGVFENQA